MIKNTTVYDAASIQVLDYPENIQRRPGMYVGGKGESALHHLAIEVIDNSVDEALVGVCDNIDVVIEKDGSITITDTGRGFPVGIHPEKGKSSLEVAFTELHAGGKFEEGSYSTSGGLHGVGIKATNALSTWLEVEVKRDGVIYSQRYELGLPVTDVLILDPLNREKIGKVGQLAEKTVVRTHAKRKIGTGSQVKFMPNPDYLDVVEFKFSTLARRLQIVAFLVPGLRVHIVDKREDQREREYQYNGGIKEYVNYLNTDRKTIHSPIEINGITEDDSQVEIVFQYHDQDDEEIISFVNTIPTPDGGKHVAGFRSALTKATNIFAAEKKLLKSGDEITGRDTISGITAVINVSMRDPQFTSQTKTQLGSDQIQGQMHSIVYDALLTNFRKNIPLGKKIVTRCLAASRARHAATKARALVMRRSVLEVDELPGKLADVAKGVPIDQTTLYIVEGDSAGGSCKQARNRNYHAILPLRGKILNTERIRLGKALANTEVKSIVAAIGAGVGSDFDVNKMRYGRIAILVDADVDGDHIKTLLYTLFWRLMRPMVEEGKLHIARAPLYLLRNGKQSQYAYTETERDRIIKSWGKKSSVNLQRYKGLGEMNPSQLRETVFKKGIPDPALNEHLVKVTVNDIHAANTTVALWMGGAPEQRRTRLMQFWEGEVLDDNGNGKTNRSKSSTRKPSNSRKASTDSNTSLTTASASTNTPSTSSSQSVQTARSRNGSTTKASIKRTRRTT